MADAVLEVHAADKRFGATHALRRASLSIQPGEVVALLGENGAGKSTLTKIIAGELRPDSGTLRVAGRPQAFRSVADAIRAGISRVPQELQVFAGLPVHENLFAGHMPTRRGLLRTGTVDRAGSREAARRLAEDFAVELPLDARCAELSFAQKQLVMLLRALTHEVRLLILDEPTAALEHKEVQLLFEVIRGLSARSVAVLYITHRLPERREIATRAIVMRDGQVVGAVAREDFDTRQLGTALLGDLRQPAGAPRGAADAAAAAGALKAALPLRLFGQAASARPGEIAGYTGLLGSGVESLLRDAYLRSTQTDAGFISGERGTQVFYALSILHNICAPHLALFSRAGHVDRRKARAAVAALIAAFDIRPSDPDRALRELSGGNQQKVLLARWFVRRMDALLLAEPTAGVDIGAKQLIQRMVAQYRADGGAVLLSSTDYEELVALCDRITPVVQGRLLPPIDRGDGFDTEQIRTAIGAS
jgi:ribose transport system ATP-binding protein